ncbi:hypothetical protein [Streptomyces sp. NBC_01439]|nr:hypothetical protein [Streptomyces sp. NBC_01439]
MRLLDWLGDTANDANDECVALDADVRRSAMIAAVPLIEHPLLTY